MVKLSSLIKILPTRTQHETLSKLWASASCKCCIFVLYFSEMLYLIQQVLYFLCVASAGYSTKNTPFEWRKCCKFLTVAGFPNDWGVSTFIKPEHRFCFAAVVFTPVRMFRKLNMR